MIYQRKSIHHISDARIAKMPLAAEEPTMYDRHPVLFWLCALSAIILAAWVSM